MPEDGLKYLHLERNRRELGIHLLRRDKVNLLCRNVTRGTQRSAPAYPPGRRSQCTAPGRSRRHRRYRRTARPPARTTPSATAFDKRENDGLEYYCSTVKTLQKGFTVATSCQPTISTFRWQKPYRRESESDVASTIGGRAGVRSAEVLRFASMGASAVVVPTAEAQTFAPTERS